MYATYHETQPSITTIKGHTEMELTQHPQMSLEVKLVHLFCVSFISDNILASFISVCPLSTLLFSVHDVTTAITG